MKTNIYVIRWASERIIGVKIIFSFISGERAGQPAKSDRSGYVHVIGGAGEAEGGDEGAGLLGRAGGEGSLAESLLCLVKSDQAQDHVLLHLHNHHSFFQNCHQTRRDGIMKTLSPDGHDHNPLPGHHNHQVLHAYSIHSCQSSTVTVIQCTPLGPMIGPQSAMHIHCIKVTVKYTQYGYKSNMYHQRHSRREIGIFPTGEMSN